MSTGFNTSQLWILAIVATLALATVGCGHDAVPMQVRYTDFENGALKGFDGSRPLIVEFQKGDRIPVELQLSGEGFELDQQHSQLELVVTQHGYARFDSKGIRTGSDQTKLDEKPTRPGTFRFGFGARAGQRGKLDIIIEGARH